MRGRWDDILVRINRAQRFLPALSRVRTASDEVTEHWKELARQSNRVVLAQLWEKIVQNDGDVSLRSREWLRVPTLFFSDLDEEHRKLCAFPEVFRQLLLCAEEGEELQRVRENSLTGFFAAYPAEALVPDLFPDIRRFFFSDTSERVLSLADKGYFSDEGAAKVAERVPSNACVHDFLLRDGGEVVTRGRFAFLVWRAAIPRYAELLAQHKTRVTVKEALVLIRLDFRTMQETRGVGLDERVALARGLLGWFNEEMSNPDEVVQEALFEFLTELLGNPKEKEAQANWANLPEDLRAFFEHLALGRSLNQLFDFADEYLADNPLDAAHWRNRKRYWMRYWRDRRIVAAKVYARLNNEVAQRWKGKIPMGAYSSLFTPRQILLVLEFEDGVTAFEFSHNGALRFSRRLRTPTRRNSWNFYEVKEHTREFSKVNHTTGWESRADEQIERLTGQPTPRY